MVVYENSLQRDEHFYRPQTKFSKVMFPQVFVCLQEGSASMYAGIPCPPLDRAPPPGPGTPYAVHAGRYGQQAGGMHPTGM